MATPTNETQRQDAAGAMKQAFRKLFAGGERLCEGEGFIARDLGRGLQWNSDRDLSDCGLPPSTTGRNRVKFGINVEQRAGMRAIFSGNLGELAAALQGALVELPDSVHLRIYKHRGRGSKDPVYEHCARQMRKAEIKEVMELISTLLGGQLPGFAAGFPKPHLHLYKEMWHEGEPLELRGALAGMREAKHVLDPTMELLRRHTDGR